MTISEMIVERIRSLPESLQAEVLDFVMFLENKSASRERTNWSALSLTQAMRGMETEDPPYTLEDLKESF